MPSMKIKEFVEIVRQVRAQPPNSPYIDDALIALAEDLAYIETLCRLADEASLDLLAADPEGRLW